MTDCQTFTAPRHEGTVHHIARAVHNLFHPRHRIEAPAAPLIQAHVCVAPELETVTVSTIAPVEPSFPPDVPHVATYGGASGGYLPGTFVGAPYGAAPHGPLHAPELSGNGCTGALLLLAGLLAVIRGRRAS